MVSDAYFTAKSDLYASDISKKSPRLSRSFFDCVINVSQKHT